MAESCRRQREVSGLTLNRVNWDKKSAGKDFGRHSKTFVSFYNMTNKTV
jgi:hypothetical protein